MRKRSTLPTSPPNHGAGVLGPVLGAANSVTRVVEKPAAEALEPVTPATAPIGRIETNAPNPSSAETPERKQPELQGIPGGQAASQSPTAEGTGASPQAKPNAPKERRPFYISRDVIEEARGAVEALLGTEHRISLNLLAESALRRELKRLAKTHNDGKPFDPPMRHLPVGRQVGR